MTRPESGSNFKAAFWFLPRERRQALSALYSFCRRVDDAVDEEENGIRAQEKLSFWRKEIENLYRGRAGHPVTEALEGPVRIFDLPREPFERILDGMERDLRQSRYATFDELLGYCFEAASAVGLLSIRIFGCRHHFSRHYAVQLGYAFQLTNILRDVGQDSSRGRVYLPLEDLSRFGCSEEEILARRFTPAFAELMRFECVRAREFYRRAEGFLTPEDEKALKPAKVMAAIYEEILDRIEAGGCDVFQSVPRVPSWRKALLAFKIWLD